MPDLDATDLLVAAALVYVADQDAQSRHYNTEGVTMSATTTQTIPLLDCPACGESIELHATYDVRLDQSADVSAATEKVAAATLTMTGARVHHECPPKSGFSAGGIYPRGPGGFIPPPAITGEFVAAGHAEASYAR